MTTLDPKRDAEVLPSANHMNNVHWGVIKSGLHDLAVMAGQVTAALQRFVVETAVELDEQHSRAQKLAAYKKRHSWKSADVARLKAFDVSAIAKRRMARVPSRRGRAVVPELQPLTSRSFFKKARALQIVMDPNSTSGMRRTSVKNTHWWPYHVEALYRGERDLAKDRGEPGPADYAERTIGKALGMSASAIHGICGKIRQEQAENPDDPGFPSMTLEQFEIWMNTGERYWDAMETTR